MMTLSHFSAISIAMDDLPLAVGPAITKIGSLEFI